MTEIKVDIDLSKNLDQVTRDAGKGYMFDGDEVVRQKDWIRKLCHQKVHQNTYWYRVSIAIYTTAGMVIVSTITYLLTH